MRSSIQTPGRVTVYLDSYYIQDTYAGSLEGVPSVEDTYGHAQRRLERLWGSQRPTLLVKPDNVTTFLPVRCMMAWLNSYQTPLDDKDSDGSHLFVIWFSHVDPENPLLAALEHVEKAGGWWAHAKGWGI